LGIALAFLAGGGAIAKREDGLEFWRSVPFGTGAGVTVDEIAVLTELDNPFWESGRLVLTQAAIAALGAIGFAIRFHRHGIRGGGYVRGFRKARQESGQVT
jgi:hypothetical protein